MTLRELFIRLGDVKRAHRTPSKRELEAETPMAEAAGCRAYDSGYALYQGENGIAVLWIKDCCRYTYRFRSGGPGVSETAEVSCLEEEWYFPIILFGEDHLEELGQRRLQRRACAEEALPRGTAPETEDIVIRREICRAGLSAMPPLHRQAFLLYHGEGYTQAEIAGMLGVDRRTVARWLHSSGHPSH